jgi:hypothetical protein
VAFLSVGTRFSENDISSSVFGSSSVYNYRGRRIKGYFHLRESIRIRWEPIGSSSWTGKMK